MKKEKENIKIKTLAKEFKRNRKEEHFEQLIEHLRNRIEFLKQKYFCFGKDEEDIEQECFIKLLEAIDQYDETKNTCFAAFAMLVIERHLINEFKKTQQKRKIPQNDFVSLDEEIESEEAKKIERIETIADEKSDIYNDLKKTERKENVKIILEYFTKHLSTIELHCVLLRMYDYNYSEIADKLNIKKKAVDNALQRSYFKIKKEIKDL